MGPEGFEIKKETNATLEILGTGDADTLTPETLNSDESKGNLAAAIADAAGVDVTDVEIEEITEVTDEQDVDEVDAESATPTVGQTTGAVDAEAGSDVDPLAPLAADVVAEDDTAID